MRVITKCVMDIGTLQVFYEESYEYIGEVVECKGSGGGGGGGSGAVSYPTYMQTTHNDWLDNTGVDTITDSITDVMNSALGSSPWTTQSAYDPDSDISDWETAISSFAAILAGITDTTDWDALYTQAEASIGTITGISEAVIVADVSAFANQLDDEITTKVLPRFEAGMRDINAVVSSAFPIGRSIIESFRDREVAKHDSSIRLNAAFKNADIDVNERNLYLKAANQMLYLMVNRINWERDYANAVVESNRIKIVAKKEQNETDIKIDENDALWDLEAFQYGANLLAGIGGGTIDTRKGPSAAQSVIGGAMSGAAAGAMLAGASEGAIGGPTGMIAGAVLGAASAML